MGLTFAVLLAVISYVVAPMLIELAEDKNDNIKAQFDDFRENEKVPEHALDWIAIGLMWMLLLGVTMFFASALVGKDPKKESLKTMSASPANKKAMIKQMQRDLKEAKKQQKQQKRK
ncbi:MAG TPA: hypothetical protein VHP83_12585 [Aggregatilineaceae bacterium]|nr:hypothetical protein [Aggregatilineaceae bacterium]